MSELGRGAASIIYLVQDPKTKQVWAMKHVAKETPKDQRFLDQAECEYQVANELDHPRIRKIVRLIRKKESLVSLSASELLLIMEFVDGSSLERRPPQTFEDAARIFEEVAQALAHMHKSGFVHADMKPNNIIADANWDCKIIDLGQSCRVGTVKERIQGTPDYIAPEQVHRRPITEKTDIYNLGATMYWVVTHQYVPTALAKADSLVGSKEDHLIERPKRTVELNPRVPELFDRLIMECVEVDPAKRPATMDDVAARLNLIRAKLLAESRLRKSGSHPRIDAPPGEAEPAGRRNGEEPSPARPSPTPPRERSAGQINPADL
jgi:serine/threonine-protein kinase